MSSFSRFQDINKKRGIANQETNTSFIIKGYPSISLTNSAGDSVDASVVNQQEKDMAYIYTHLNNPLEIGSSWGAKGLHWLISEEIVTIKNVNWHKYLAFLCNVEIDGNWGYFLGPKKSYVNVVLKEKMLLMSEQKPILICAAQFDINDKIMIKNRAWLIQEVDNISTPGLNYYSLTVTTMSKDVIKENKDKDVFIEKASNVKIETPETGDLIILPNEEIEIVTEDGYFDSSEDIDIISTSENKIVFSVPFGIENVLVSVKNQNRIVQYNYVVKEL